MTAKFPYIPLQAKKIRLNFVFFFAFPPLSKYSIFYNKANEDIKLNNKNNSLILDYIDQKSLRFYIAFEGDNLTKLKGISTRIMVL